MRFNSIRISKEKELLLYEQLRISCLPLTGNNDHGRLSALSFCLRDSANALHLRHPKKRDSPEFLRFRFPLKNPESFIGIELWEDYTTGRRQMQAFSFFRDFSRRFLLL
jgi:hypothetical protein